MRACRYLPHLGALSALLIAISGESFWIDELTTAVLASQPTWGDLREKVATFGSEAQMPLFTIYTWLWAKIFGTGELALRWANAPWALIGVVAVDRLLVRCGARRMAVLLLMAPLFCFYMNEARPYVATFATACVALAAGEALLAAHAAGRGKPPGAGWFFPAGMLACAAISMLNLFLVPALLAYALVAFAGRGRRAITAFVRAHVGPLAAAFLGLVLLSGYYIWTLLAGHGGQHQPYTWINLGYAVYEWLGFGGLGEPRHALRADGPLVNLADHWHTLSLGALAWGLVALTALKNRGRLWANRCWCGAGIGLLCGGACLVLTAVLAPASLWGRHLIFLSPFYVVCLAGVIMPAGRPDSRLGRTAGLLLLAALALSTGLLRFDDLHQKDPYRDGIIELRENLGPYENLPIIWVANEVALRVYGAKRVSPGDPFLPDPGAPRPRVIPAAGWAASGVREWSDSHPEYILLIHRPQTFDIAGSWEAATRWPGSSLLWQRSDMRIYHITSQQAE